MVWPPNLIVLVSNVLKFKDPHREDNFSLTASHPSRAISEKAEEALRFCQLSDHCLAVKMLSQKVCQLPYLGKPSDEA